MSRILGIDPGSRVTGFGVVEAGGDTARYVASGCVRVTGETLPERLRCIFEGITEVLETHSPDEVAVEQVFMNRNASAALKLGQARGVAMVAGVLQSLPVSEYTPAQIKLTIAGHGGADKGQIQQMVRRLLSLPDSPPEDAADALAVALCHGYSRRITERLPMVRGHRRGRLL